MNRDWIDSEWDERTKPLRPEEDPGVNANLLGRRGDPDEIEDIPDESTMERIPLNDTYAGVLSAGSVIQTRSPRLTEGGPTGLESGGTSSDSALDILDETQENVVAEGASGESGTGGDLTGERTPGGMSEDLTSGRAGGGIFGGPTGGAYMSPDREPSHARSGPKTKPERSELEIDRELERRVAAQNTARLINKLK